jgi:hypothetical protein
VVEFAETQSTMSKKPMKHHRHTHHKSNGDFFSFENTLISIDTTSKNDEVAVRDAAQD